MLMLIYKENHLAPWWSSTLAASLFPLSAAWQQWSLVISITNVVHRKENYHRSFFDDLYQVQWSVPLLVLLSHPGTLCIACHIWHLAPCSIAYHIWHPGRVTLHILCDKRHPAIFFLAPCILFGTLHIQPIWKAYFAHNDDGEEDRRLSQPLHWVKCIMNMWDESC